MKHYANVRMKRIELPQSGSFNQVTYRQGTKYHNETHQTKGLNSVRLWYRSNRFDGAVLKINHFRLAVSFTFHRYNHLAYDERC